MTFVGITKSRWRMEMKYNGIELEPSTKSFVCDEGKEMLVWDIGWNEPKLALVLAHTPTRTNNYKVICKSYSYIHCAEIPPAPTKRDMNPLEVMEYLHDKQVLLDKTDGGVVVYRVIKGSWKNYTQFTKFNYSNISYTFGFLKNGTVAEFTLPQVDDMKKEE